MDLDWLHLSPQRLLGMGVGAILVLVVLAIRGRAQSRLLDAFLTAFGLLGLAISVLVWIGAL